MKYPVKPVTQRGRDASRIALTYLKKHHPERNVRSICVSVSASLTWTTYRSGQYVVVHSSGFAPLTDEEEAYFTNELIDAVR